MPGAVLEVQGLRKVYRSRRRGPVVAVDDVSFSVGGGEIVGLLGPNGAGKTTTIKCLCGLVRPTAGRTLVEGSERLRDGRVAAVLEGNRNVYWRLTPLENLEFFAALSGTSRRALGGRALELLEAFGLADKRDAETRALSRGMQQKLAVACAFVRDARVLLLDEPTLGLDVETSLELREMLKRLAVSSGRTILLSSHDMDVVQDICERVIILSGGRVVTDDRVASLLELFRARAYRFTVSDDLTPPQQEAVRAAFPSARVQRNSVDVELLDGDRFYDLVDVLRRLSCTIETVDRRDPDLADVFLRIVRGTA